MPKFFGDKSEQSNTIRELLQPESLNRKRVPLWIHTAIKDAVKRGDLPASEFPLLSANVAFEHATKCLGGSWADHAGTIKDENGQELLVAEPYWTSLNQTSFRQLDQFAQLVNAGYTISPNSEHFPGWTLRIIVGQRDDSNSAPRMERPAKRRKRETVS